MLRRWEMSPQSRKMFMDMLLLLLLLQGKLVFRWVGRLSIIQEAQMQHESTCHHLEVHRTGLPKPRKFIWPSYFVLHLTGFLW
jgi:hypothetical protein